LTFSPTLTVSVASVPPETKFSWAVFTVERLPDAETLAWTVPLVTLTVLVTVALDDDVE
jgi:hypothetical protein